MEIILEDGPLKDTVRTHDAVKAFNTAVANGQARLAMEILVPIINAITKGNDRVAEPVSSGASVSTSEIKNDTKATSGKSQSVRQKESGDTDK